VLAGLATLETRAGAAVEAGAPLGLLGGRALDAQEFLMLAGDASGETPGETLYIEVRQGQGPVDPTPLFTDGNG
jgi:septal ring factor EnvC (AmiA/AmiB activator)